jgi:hypothetical protein
VVWLCADGRDPAVAGDSGATVDCQFHGAFWLGRVTGDGRVSGRVAKLSAGGAERGSAGGAVVGALAAAAGPGHGETGVGWADVGAAGHEVSGAEGGAYPAGG